MESPKLHTSMNSHGVGETRIPSPASTVFISTPINDNEGDTRVFLIENQDSFGLRGNTPVEEDQNTPTFLPPVTPLSQSEVLSSAMCSADQANNNGSSNPSSNDQTSNSTSVCSTPSPSRVAQPVTNSPEIPIISNSALPFSNERVNVPSGTSSVVDNSADHQSFGESYICLTPWTNRLAEQPLGQMPLPTKENYPIPLSSFNHHPCLPVSSHPIRHSHRHLRTATSNPMFSKLSPIPHVSAAHKDGASHSDQSTNSPMHRLNTKIRPVSNKDHRFKKTADALQKSGLWEVAMKTGNLIKRNQELQKELEQFRSDALLFLKSVIKNPQNRDFIKTILNNALTANSTQQKKTSVMSVVVSAAAAVASKKFRSSSSTHDSGLFSDGSVSSSGSQSDHSVSNFPFTGSETVSPRSKSNDHKPMDIQ